MKYRTIFSMVSAIFLLSSCSDLWNVKETANITFEIKGLTSAARPSSTPQGIGDDSDLIFVQIELIDAIANNVVAEKSGRFPEGNAVINFGELPLVGKKIFARVSIINSDAKRVGESESKIIEEGTNHLTVKEFVVVDNDDDDITYSITYVLDGAVDNGGNPSEYTSEDDTIVLKNPTKYGFSFGGWYTNSSFAAEYLVSSIPKGSTGEKTFYAKWNAIGKITKPEANNTLTYNGELQTYTPDGFDDTTMEVVAGGESHENVGTYSITIGLKDKVNTTWEDGGTENVVLQWQIIPLLLPKPTADTTVFTYTGSEQTYEPQNLPDYVTVSGNKQTNAGDYTNVEVRLNNTENTKWEGNSIEPVTFTWTIKKASYAKVTADTTVFTDTGSEQTYTPEKFNSSVMNITGNAKTEAGTTDVTVSLKDKNNTQWVDGTTDDIVFSWTINAVPDPSPFTFDSALGDSGVRVTGYTGTDTVITIPSTDGNGNAVTEISSLAPNKTILTEVTIPEGVKVLNSWALGDIITLKKVTLPSTLTTIGADAFNGCSGLTEIIIPESVIDVRSYAFKGCDILTINCEREDPINVTLIGWDASWNPDNRLVVWSYSASGGTPAELEYTYDGFTGGYIANLKSGQIGTDVTIPDQATTTERGTLNVTKINATSFQNSGIVSVFIGSNVSTIDGSTFKGCTSLERVTIGSGVTSIEVWAFNGCTALESIYIPVNVTEIEGNAFFGSTQLTINCAIDELEVTSGWKDNWDRLSTTTLASVNWNQPAP